MPGLAFPKPLKAARRRVKKARRELQAAATALIRAMVFARERGLCRAWVDGHRFRWCTKFATDLHEGKTRGAGGAVSTTNSVAVCHGCHMTRHGIGAWVKILVTDANRPGGVTFIPRATTRREAA